MKNNEKLIELIHQINNESSDDEITQGDITEEEDITDENDTSEEEDTTDENYLIKLSNTFHSTRNDNESKDLINSFDNEKYKINLKELIDKLNEQIYEPIPFDRDDPFKSFTHIHSMNLQGRLESRTIQEANPQKALLLAINAGDLERVKTFDFSFDYILTNKEKKQETVAMSYIMSMFECYKIDSTTTHIDSHSPLTLAVYKQYPDIVESLLEKGADPDFKNANDKTALMIAVERNNLHLIKLLLEKGATPDLATKDGITPLMIAVANEKETLYPETKRHEINCYGILSGFQSGEVFEGSRELATPEESLEIVKLLLKYPQNVNAKDRDGRTALMIASRKRKSDIENVLKSDSE